MGTPSESILDILEAARKKDALFQNPLDFAAQDRWVSEQVARLGASVHLVPTSTQRQPQGSLESSGVDPLDGDVIDPRYIDNQQRLNFRCLIEHQPSKQLLKKYGIDEEREIVFYFPVGALEKVNLITEKRFRGIDIGDLVIWDRTWYIVTSSHRTSYFGQTDKPYFVGAFCDRYRHNSVPTDQRPDNCPEESI